MLPTIITAEYKVRFQPNFSLLTSIDHYREAKTHREYNAIVSAVEAMLMSKMKMERLGTYARERDRVRIDYRSFRHENPGIVYVNRPRRNKNFEEDPEDNPLVVAFSELGGIDWSTKCKRSEQRSIPDIYKF